jgi:hypothetical protein
MSTPRSLRRRGQSGLTIVELLLAISVGTIVLLPMFGLVTLIIKRQEPTIKSANASKQLRLFRTTMEKDWAAAKVIKIGVIQANAAGVECNGGDMTSILVTPTWPVVGPRIAIQTSGANSKRIIYNTRPNTTLGGIDILRRECFHNTDIIGGLDYWRTGTRVTDPGGSQVVIVQAVQSFTIPSTCNLQATFPKAPPLPPYEMCDMNITVVGRDGQSSTVRLHQHAGRDS